MADYCIPCDMEYHLVTEDEARSLISGWCKEGYAVEMFCEGCGRWMWIDKNGDEVLLPKATKQERIGDGYWEIARK